METNGNYTFDEVSKLQTNPSNIMAEQFQVKSSIGSPRNQIIL